MARLINGPVQQYRGTTAQHATYTGASGEITFDISKNVLVVHDGTTAGGHPLVPEARKLIVDGVAFKVNDAAEATLAGDITLTFDGTAVTDGLIRENDELLYTTDDGKLATDITMAYDTISGKFSLTNHAGTEIGAVTVPSSISMLENVALVEDPVDPDGDGSSTLTGTFLDFDFRLADGTTKEILVDVTGLLDVYVGGLGITVTGKEIAVDVAALISTDANNWLKQGADGLLHVTAPAAGDGLQVNDQGVFAVKLAADGNQIKLDDAGAMIVPLDYGTMD